MRDIIMRQHSNVTAGPTMSRYYKAEKRLKLQKELLELREKRAFAFRKHMTARVDMLDYLIQQTEKKLSLLR